MKINRLFFLILLPGIMICHSCTKDERQMLVKTGNVSNILTTTAYASGEILDLGEGVSQHGHCWSTSPNTSIDDTKSNLGVPPGTGGFTSELTGLQPGTTYFVKAYCSRGSSTVYGNEISFSTASADLAQLTTTEVTGITKTGAVSGGNIVNQGGTPVTARGVCWSTASNPTTDNSKTINGSGTGAFVSNISSLEAGTEYFVRAYATNSGGTAYGNELGFSTESDTPIPPTVTTASITSITSNSANSGGEVTDEGSETVTARGVCWSINPNPTVSNSKTINGTGLGSFISNITGLDPGVTYYLRAYATSNAGTSYGEEYTFTTGAVLPELNTLEITNITTNSASSGGNITSDGGANIIARGVCWSTSSTPELSDNVTSDGTGIGTFSSEMTGLSDNTIYFVRAYATNSIGTAYGNELSFATDEIPTTVPDPPAMGSATPGNEQATVTFTAPANDGGAPITGFTVTSDPGGITASGSGSPITITGLTNGTLYTFTVTATNTNGESASSSASNAVIPSTVPGAPIVGTASAGNAQASITFLAPVNDGGSTITAYTARSNPGGLTGTGISSPVIVAGLTNGTSYTFTVTASNINGEGPASSSTNAVTPSTVPGAPIIGSATAGNGQATVSFSAPSSDGGSAITGYIVTSSPGSIWASGSTSPITVPGLTNGVTYTFTVTATNTNGTGSASSASNSVTPSTTPGAPLIGPAIYGDKKARVTFSPPASDGGATITQYIVTSSPHGITATGSGSPITIAGLSNGTSYRFTVTAINNNGSGPVSSLSNNIVPALVPTVFNSTTGEVWMDRNLGASRVATSSTDDQAYGYLYQWGRFSDGHQVRTSEVTYTLSTTDTPGHSDFILAPDSPWDWRDPGNDNLWQGTDGINNPCPCDFRIPTIEEFEAEVATWSSQNTTGGYNSPLKLTVPGIRDKDDGSIKSLGESGYYATSSFQYSRTMKLLYLSISFATDSYTDRAYGFSVRCIKE